MALISTNRECVDMLIDTLKAAPLDLAFVGKNDERRLPQYPAVVVSAGMRSKTVGPTRQFSVTLRALIWIYHANMSANHSQRSDEEMKLVESIEDALEADKTFNSRVIFGYIVTESPGFMQPRNQKGDIVIGSRLEWQADTRENFAS